MTRRGPADPEARPWFRTPALAHALLRKPGAALKGDTMNISSSTPGLQSTTSSAAASALSGARAPTVPLEVASDATSVDLSKPGELLSALKALKDAEPEQFSKVVSQIAEQVRGAAEGAVGADQQALRGFADKLEQVASTKDLSALQPPPEGPPGRGLRAYAPPTPEASAPLETDAREVMDAVLAKVTQELQAATSAAQEP